MQLMMIILFIALLFRVHIYVKSVWMEQVKDFQYNPLIVQLAMMPAHQKLMFYQVTFSKQPPHKIIVYFFRMMQIAIPLQRA